MNRTRQIVSTIPKAAWLSFLALATLLLVRTYFFSFSMVQGASMIPTFNEGDLVFINKWSETYAPGDVIVFEDPQSKTKLVKRLIATENAEVYVDNFKLYVDRKPYRESASHPPLWDPEDYECRFTDVIRTQESEYFVMGDNRCRSKDSRLWGSIKRTHVIGKVEFTLIPGRYNPLYNYRVRPSQN